MKMKPVITESWSLQNAAKDKSNQESSQIGPMVGIGSYFCCVC